jgi:catechol 2,3-dioxygenase-like lactoylglutathione lyase family enzyme
MRHRGFTHIGLSTLDPDKTREFYEGVLGFKPAVADRAAAVEAPNSLYRWRLSAMVGVDRARCVIPLGPARWSPAHARYSHPFNAHRGAAKRPRIGSPKRDLR